MPSYDLVDTFPAFLRSWRELRTMPPDRQVEAWRRDYLRPWPDLARVQIQTYRDARQDWRAVARRRVFPALDARLPAMHRIRANLRTAFPVAVARCRAKFALDFPPQFVIHVGIGTGAGWATELRGRPTVLFGLENAAELGWTSPAAATALVEHELSHLIHDQWRRRARADRLRDPAGPWWRLYVEGFATRCEAVLGGESLPRSPSSHPSWSAWCRRNRARLAARFLSATRRHGSVDRFFGSWWNIDGYVETGYFLGAAVVEDWERGASLREISTWSPARVRSRARASMVRLAAGNRPGRGPSP